MCGCLLFLTLCKFKFGYVINRKLQNYKSEGSVKVKIDSDLFSNKKEILSNKRDVNKIHVS